MECTQNSPVHIYNLYEHIEETTNDVEPILTLKLAALFHDIGKPYSKTILDGVERFKGHEQHSVVFANMILRRLGYDEELIKNVCTLIKYHNHKTKLTVDGVSNTLNLVGETLMPYLLQLKNADLMSHALEYANLKKPSLIELSNIYSELGDGTTLNSLVPKKITLPNGIKPKQIACGYHFSLAIGSDEELYTWGYNGFGQLGDETKIDKSIPTKINIATGIKPIQIAGGNGYSIIIGSDGELYTWGYNALGQLGDGTTTTRITPKKITLASGVKPTQIACGYRHVMAIGDDGNLYAWGLNDKGQLGDGTNINKKIPTKIELASGVKPTQITCGMYHSMALGDDRKLYSWGSNQYGQLGDNTIIDKTIPINIETINGMAITQIICGGYHSMVLNSNGELYTWGWNINGQLGDGTKIDKYMPTKIEMPNN